MFCLERKDKTAWEEVDEFVYMNWEKATLPDNTPRYSGNQIRKTVGGFELLLTNGIEKDMAIICRLLGLREINGAHAPTGFLKAPEHVRMTLSRNRVVLHEINGDNFKLVEKVVVREEEAA